MSDSKSPPPSLLLQRLLLCWVGASACFFFLRFSLTFYRANQSAVDLALELIFPR